MQDEGQIRSHPLQRAEEENSLTALLHLLLDTPETIKTTHPGVDLLRSILSCNNRLKIPVMDLAAVLPDADFRKLMGLHIASYYGQDAQDRWYLDRLTEFFASGRGSLLALKEFNQWVGHCRFFELPAGAPRRVHPAREYLLTEGNPFTPLQQEQESAIKPFAPSHAGQNVTVDDRLAEYAVPVLTEFEGPATLAWISFGPGLNEKDSLTWGGSLFAVVLGESAADLYSDELKGAIESVYAILNASFYRTIVDRSRQEEAAHRLKLTYFAFGHDLKNRIERIENFSVIPLRKKIRQSAPALQPEIDQCHELLQVVAGMCGVFSAVAKAKGGRLPSSWIGPDDGHYAPTKAHRNTLTRALVAAIATFSYVEDSVDPAEQRLMLRHVQGGSVRRVKRPNMFRAIELPPFNPAVAEPHLCFLSGLAELCRNAARYVLDTRPKSAMATPHVDFSITVTESLVATVVLHNPVVGEGFKHSQSIRLLAELFEDLGKVVKIVPAAEGNPYAHAIKGYRYVESSFVYCPRNLRFEGIDYGSSNLASAPSHQ